MLQPRTRWRCAEVSEERVAKLAAEVNISPLLAKLLIVRGIDDAQLVGHFLNDTIDDMLDPYQLAGMPQAVERIRRAIAAKERIWIYGDYDADGVSSTSLMIHLMRELGADFDYYIPHRANEGYGLNTTAIDKAKEQGVTLIITVDTGISAVDQIEHATSCGIDVVVTDHHEPPEVLPKAYALVNPKLDYCPYPFKGLAGVGVAFKLAHALLDRVPEHLLDLAAIGTVADLMPLTGENRIMVKNALTRMRNSAYPGIKALLQIGNVDASALTSTHIAFSMAPRINASGRLDHADTAVQLLTTDKLDEALACAEELDRLNKERQKIVERIVKEAEQQLADKIEAAGKVPNVIVLAQAGWNVGVIGIVASKIVERYYRPTFVLGHDEETGKCKGSARSIDGFDLYGAMSQVGELFEHYGGHQAAAGMTIAYEKLTQLEQALQNIADEQLTEEQYIPCTDADAACSLLEVPIQVIDELSCLEPFGMGNSTPKVIITDARVHEKRTMGKEGQHLKLMLTQDRATLDAVAFHKGTLADRISPNVVTDVLGELSINEWNSSRKPQLMLQDIRIRERQLFDLRGSREPISAAVELTRKLNASRAGEAIWLTSRQEAGVYAAEPYVQLSDAGSFQQSQPFASEQVRDIVLSCIPMESAESWSYVGQRYPSVERVHVFLPRKPEEGLLRSPDRSRIVPAFAELKRLRTWQDNKGTLMSLSSRTGLSVRELSVLLDVFRDLEFVTVEASAAGATYSMVEVPRKTSLDASPRYKEWERLSEWESVWYDGTTDALRQLLLAAWDKPLGE
ncbi:single-stranded-DNA-specific exonuclease RecJ [Paenibacillus sp. ACRRX]|uniref:single-stranded-DNA-specific exonuclease RecJ n=1 Tax=Paenibacillus sp. ACRRX TaxID=2918206 RepID=UPI001EF5FA66|nr:single-stranded-DNA-specific exonuclease RecJ [Paenibacillus sp. ACRRX]MCG7410339.1 single-stranded-DNA-specific exonuclease RecJ [Paenibacillus sp. ACRRX]